MRKILLSIFSIVSLGFLAQVDVNFDGTWPPGSAYPASDPQGWISTNVLTSAFASASNPTSVTQSTNNCSGGFSMLVETKKFTLGALAGLVPDTCGFAFTGTVAITFSGGQLVDGFAYNQRPTEITYCYQAEPAANDTAGISAVLWKWNGSSRTYIGAAKNLYSTTNNTMANGTLTIAYSSTLTPDSMAIYVASSYKFPSNGTSIRKGAQLGSKMYVDNIQFPASTVGLSASAKNEIGLNVYPIPATSNVYFEASNNDANRIEIIDLTGKQINSVGFNNNRIKLDVADYHSGIYFYSVKNSSGKTLKTGKFSVIH